MPAITWIASVLAMLAWLGPAVLQDQGEKRTLILNGQPTQVPVVTVNGQSFVALDALAAAANGTLSYSGNTISLNLSGVNGALSANAASSNPGFSQSFLTAGIEAAATLREWHAALQSALENGIPVTAALLSPYRAQAITSVRLASAAVETPSDRKALHLMNNEFQNMARLSEKYVKLRDNLTYVAPDALQNDDLNRRIIACGHALGAMAASGQFADDGSCH
jgi:hypothetical protein